MMAQANMIQIPKAQGIAKKSSPTTRNALETTN